MILTGFSFIGLPIKYLTKLPFRINEDLIIDKPTQRQLKTLKAYLEELNSFEQYEQAFETTIIRTPMENVGDMETYRIENIDLKKEDWKYSVVKFKSKPHKSRSFETPSLEMFDFNLAGLIIEKDFMILHNFVNKLHFGWGDNLEAISQLQIINGSEKEYFWDKSDLISLKKIHNEVQIVKNQFPDIYHSLKLYSSLPKIIGYNELMCLGLFSVIESILAHNPKSTTDSIGHQIRTKIKLLSNRFDKQIDYSIFKSVPTDTLWKKLYDFRSRIAHGGKIDFDTEFQILQSAFDVQIFLIDFLKTLLRNALSEPQLYTDLKDC